MLELIHVNMQNIWFFPFNMIYIGTKMNITLISYYKGQFQFEQILQGIKQNNKDLKENVISL